MKEKKNNCKSRQFVAFYALIFIDTNGKQEWWHLPQVSSVERMASQLNQQADETLVRAD